MAKKSFHFVWNEAAIMHIVRSLPNENCDYSDMMKELYASQGCDLPVDPRHRATGVTYRSDWAAKTKQLYESYETLVQRKKEYDEFVGEENVKQILYNAWVNARDAYNKIEHYCFGTRWFTPEQTEEMRRIGKIIAENGVPKPAKKHKRSPEPATEEVDVPPHPHPQQQEDSPSVLAQALAQMERIRQEGEIVRLQMKLTMEKLIEEERTKRENIRQQEETKRMEMIVGMCFKLQKQE